MRIKSKNVFASFAKSFASFAFKKPFNRKGRKGNSRQDRKGKAFSSPPGTLSKARHDRHQFRQLDRLRHVHLVTET